MSDLIRREDVYDVLKKVNIREMPIYVFDKLWNGIRDLPSIEPEERTAKVEKVDTNSPHSQVYKCCKCGQYTHRTAWSRDVHYCPSCGARLEWE